MGGYREIENGLNGPIRNIFIQSRNPDNLIFTFSGDGIQVTPVDNNGVGGANYDVTPTTFLPDDVYCWQSDTLYDSTGTPAVKLIAHAANNLSDIDDSTNTDIYYGDATGTIPLTSIGQSVSGGITVLQPFLFIYGNNGLIKNSKENAPNTFVGGSANTANVAGTKIVKGLPLRGGSNAPAGLFWALDSLIRVSFVGGTSLWRYDTLTNKSTILSSNAVIDYDGVFYWPGVDRFLMYNGVVKEVPNQMNQDFFFDNLNWDQRQKVWVTAVPRWGEIWWFFPYGQATECNHAVIYNVRENSWYDTDIKRSSGYSPRVLSFPVWADSASNSRVSTNGYSIYRHETGTDNVFAEEQVAIQSYFETSQVGFVTGGPSGDGTQNPNLKTRISRIEPDFVQQGTMTVQVNGSTFAHTDDVQGSPISFESDTGYVDIPKADVQRREMSVKFESNEQGGDYMMGKCLMHLDYGDQRQD